MAKVPTSPPGKAPKLTRERVRRMITEVEIRFHGELLRINPRARTILEYSRAMHELAKLFDYCTPDITDA